MRHLVIGTDDDEGEVKIELFSPQGDASTDRWIRFGEIDLGKV